MRIEQTIFTQIEFENEIKNLILAYDNKLEMLKLTINNNNNINDDEVEEEERDQNWNEIMDGDEDNFN